MATRSVGLSEYNVRSLILFISKNATLYPFYTPRDFLPACIIQTYFTNHFNFLLSLRRNGSFNEKKIDKGALGIWVFLNKQSSFL